MFKKICELFQADQIPFENLVSDLSDSANFMCGEKGGLENRLRDKARTFWISTVIFVKAFWQLLDNFVKKWIDDLHTDNKWSADIRDALKEFFFLLKIPFRMRPLRISHRWLIIFFDTFVLLYYSWFPDNEKHLYKEDVCLLYERYDLNEETINIVKSFHVKFKAKNLTKEG